jgi:hypothetical protein
MFRPKLNSLTQPLTRNTPDRLFLSRTQSGETTSFWRAWRWWAPPALIALALVLYFVDPFIGDWDGMDYTMLSIDGYPSSMALGRNLFIFSNHLLFVIGNKLFHVPPEHAYLIFKYAVVIQAPLAIVMCWLLARDITGSLRTATIAALLIVFAPVFVLYGGQVMTDVPSVLLLATALAVHLRGVQNRKLWLILAGAALLGIGVNLRETIGFYLPWLVLAPFVCGWKFERRTVLWIAASCGLFLVLAFSWFGYWYLTDPHYRWVWNGWRESMREESSRHPVQLANIFPYLLYYFISAPLVFVTIVFAPWFEWRKHRMTPMFALWLVGFVANLLLFFNYSTTVNWRYFMTGLPALVPLGAFWMLRLAEKRLRTPQRAFVACAGAIVAVAVLLFIYMRPVSSEFIERRAMSREYKHRLEQVPPDAVMISGSQTIAVHYWAAIDEHDWKTIGTGGGWPGDRLFSTIENYQRDGRRVFVDADPRWWLPCGWQREEIPMIVKLEEHFSFRRVTDTIYELRPLGDPAATDRPNLSRLLPENRPEDTRKCPPARS